MYGGREPCVSAAAVHMRIRRDHQGWPSGRERGGPEGAEAEGDQEAEATRTKRKEINGPQMAGNSLRYATSSIRGRWSPPSQRCELCDDHSKTRQSAGSR
jgi:hypothetical protein